jgi:hypothetical protein
MRLLTQRAYLEARGLPSAHQMLGLVCLPSELRGGSVTLVDCAAPLGSALIAGKQETASLESMVMVLRRLGVGGVMQLAGGVLVAWSS